MIRLLILSLFLSCSQEKLVKHTQANYEISYPESWKKQENPNMVLFLSPKEGEKDQFQENVNVMVQDLSNQPMTLEEYTNLTKQQIIQALGSTAIISIKDIDFAERHAKEMIYTMTMNPIAGINLNLKLWQIWFIKDNKAFVITYTAKQEEYDRYLEIARQIFDSIKLK